MCFIVDFIYLVSFNNNFSILPMSYSSIGTSSYNHGKEGAVMGSKPIVCVSNLPINKKTNSSIFVILWEILCIHKYLLIDSF